MGRAVTTRRLHQTARRRGARERCRSQPMRDRWPIAAAHLHRHEPNAEESLDVDGLSPYLVRLAPVGLCRLADALPTSCGLSFIDAYR